MKTLTRYLLAAILIALLPECQNKPVNTPVQEASPGSDVPPSIAQATAEKVLIRLSPDEIKQLNIQSQVVESQMQKLTVAAPGVVFPAADHIAIISAPINGRISLVRANDGQEVRRGQELFRIESLEFGNMVSEYLQAVAEEKFQAKRTERTQLLVEQTISSESELDRAKTDHQRASAAVIASYAKLKAIGVSESEIASMREAENIDPTLKIYAPVGGLVDNREVELGQAVDALQKLARVIDLSKVQIKGYLSPEDALLVNLNDTVLIRQRQLEERPIVAQISSVNPGLDENNRSVVVNIVIGTLNGWPKPGENVKLEIKTSSLAEMISIPVDALSYEGNDPVVFVKHSDATYEKRKIALQAIRDQKVVIASGITRGESIAVTQVFSLKALSRYEQIAEE